MVLYLHLENTQADLRNELCLFMNCEKHSLTLCVSLYVKQVRNHLCKAFTAMQTCHVCIGLLMKILLAAFPWKYTQHYVLLFLLSKHMESGYMSNKTLVKYSLSSCNYY